MKRYIDKFLNKFKKRIIYKRLDDLARDINQQIAVGKEADILLRDSAIATAFDEVEAVYAEQLLNSSAYEHKEREHIYIRVQALRDVKSMLQQYVADAKIEIRNSDKESV